MARSFEERGNIKPQCNVPPLLYTRQETLGGKKSLNNLELQFLHL